MNSLHNSIPQNTSCPDPSLRSGSFHRPGCYYHIYWNYPPAGVIGYPRSCGSTFHWSLVCGGACTSPHLEWSWLGHNPDPDLPVAPGPLHTWLYPADPDSCYQTSRSPAPRCRTPRWPSRPPDGFHSARMAWPVYSETMVPPRSLVCCAGN